jgi:hypothetical protein
MNKNDLKIVYVAPIDSQYFGTCTQRMRALKELGHQLIPLCSEFYDSGIVCRVRRKLFGTLPNIVLSHKILEIVKSHHPDMLWLDKELTVPSDILRYAKKMHSSMIIVGYSPDDMMNKCNRSRYWLKSLPFYDVYLTTKSYNMEELKQLGCKHTIFVPNAFDPKLHRPVDVPKDERRQLGGPVGFIGTAENDRAQSVTSLTENGIGVKVWGDKWNKFKKITKGEFQVCGPSQYGEQYVKIICSFDINLSFLRKANRDLQTTRSMEIPACGGFMLAERTDEHLELFEEGKEAEFFGNNEELLDKIKYYLAHDKQREQIARAGREKCLKSGYSNQDRLKEALKEIVNLKGL